MAPEWLYSKTCKAEGTMWNNISIDLFVTLGHTKQIIFQKKIFFLLLKIAF
jgi:hypothetical protein